MNRFKWVDSHSIRVINAEGLEKIVDMKENFAEVSYNKIPLYDKRELKDPLRHFFTNREPLSV